MVVLRAIGRFFARIGRWIKDTAWIQPLLIVGGIFAIIFSIPYLTKWVKSWFNEESASEKYFSSKKLSLKNADKDQGKSEADDLFRYLDAYSKDEQTADQEKKFGKKFFLTLVQKECEACEERYDGFKKLEKEWGSGNFASLKGDESFKLHTIFVDTKNDDGDSLFEEVYERNNEFFEEAIYYMSGESNPKGHPYVYNSGDTGFVSSLDNLIDNDNISTPTTFVIDLTKPANDAWWISPHGIREVLFSFDGADGDNNAFGRAKTLRNAWGNVEDVTNVYSPKYVK